MGVSGDMCWCVILLVDCAVPWALNPNSVPIGPIGRLVGVLADKAIDPETCWEMNQKPEQKGQPTFVYQFQLRNLVVHAVKKQIAATFGTGWWLR